MTTDYIKMKNEVNYNVYKHYQQEVYRKLKWYGYINRQKSEDKMMNRFEKLFGKAEDTIICIGDWTQKKQIKFSPPTKGIGMRKILRKKNYDVFLVDEYKTSKINCYTGLENEKFRKRQNPRPWKKNVRRCKMRSIRLLRSISVPQMVVTQPFVTQRQNTS